MSVPLRKDNSEELSTADLVVLLRFSPRNAPISKASGAAVKTSPPKTFALRSNAIVRFFIDCCPFNPVDGHEGRAMADCW